MTLSASGVSRPQITRKRSGVEARRRLHQHHFGAGAPLRFDDEQDGDFFILVHKRCPEVHALLMSGRV